MTLRSLPSEILLSILRLLPTKSLVCVSITSKYLNILTKDDSLWKSRCGVDTYQSPYPYLSYRKFYQQALHRHGYLRGIWLCDEDFEGALVYIFYQLSTKSYQFRFLDITRDGESTALHLNPISFSRSDGISLIERIDESIVTRGKYSSRYKDGDEFPPRNIPAEARISRSILNVSTGHCQTSIDNLSTRFFQLASDCVGIDTSGRYRNLLFYKLDPRMWQPHPDRPFRGMWAASYGPHGNEFIWFSQPDVTTIDAVKLTGDINVPRGESSFKITLKIEDTPDPDFPNRPVCRGKGQISEIYFHQLD
ncbi:hypothetical protein NEOLI_000131 [Neolecta irregularis DAH-3]|uniref:F-box domain-containing protein n=1 Tax=Neolecta irregularis (strain DAH-3) TaxID=1198029 RepID=A0A1U7LQT9_NEOID|nr:hypothetical protein NEOLI_000131 [Neolecta irregularis DAH-3]|eukprot:OLL25025.1 hypothetical protein NEOLI_000131 [Neolecta irregularis DAH-3]